MQYSFLLAVYYSPRTQLCYNWKFVPLDSFQPFHPLPTPIYWQERLRAAWEQWDLGAEMAGTNDSPQTTTGHMILMQASLINHDSPSHQSQCSLRLLLNTGDSSNGLNGSGVQNYFLSVLDIWWPNFLYAKFRHTVWLKINLLIYEAICFTKAYNQITFSHTFMTEPLLMTRMKVPILGIVPWKSRV